MNKIAFFCNDILDVVDVMNDYSKHFETVSKSDQDSITNQIKLIQLQTMLLKKFIQERI